MLNLVEGPAANLVREMAVYFNTDLVEGNDASTITMNNKKAKGSISSYQLFNGLSVCLYNIAYSSEFKIDLALSRDGPIYFYYNIKGHFLNRFGEQGKFVKVLQNQSMILIGSPHNSIQITFPANLKLEIAVIIVDTKILGSLAISNAKRMSTKIQKLFERIPKNQPYRYLGHIDTETAKYASKVCENNSTSLVGELLTEGAVLNMLASQIEAYESNTTETGLRSSLSKSDLSNISSLGSFVIDNFDTNLTILKLSRHFGVSPKKLQMGVKHLYGDSVGRYILNLRMGHAKHLLSTTDLNVSEVCSRVGISSGSYFSRVFKNRFGMLPSHYKEVVP
jgi:AraC-like DNA-binding protein